MWYGPGKICNELIEQSSDVQEYIIAFETILFVKKMHSKGILVPRKSNEIFLLWVCNYALAVAAELSTACDCRMPMFMVSCSFCCVFPLVLPFLLPVVFFIFLMCFPRCAKWKWRQPWKWNYPSCADIDSPLPSPFCLWWRIPLGSCSHCGSIFSPLCLAMLPR